MTSVRVEGFPSPDAKTMMEAMVRVGRYWLILAFPEAYGTNQSVVKVYKMLQELVGDV